MEKLDDKLLKEFLKTLITTFDKYADSIILDYDKNKFLVAGQLLPELSEEKRNKLIQKLEQSLKNPQEIRSIVFISSNEVKNLKK